MKKLITSLLFFLFLAGSNFSQEFVLPLNNQFSKEEALLNIPDYVHTSVRPIRTEVLYSLKVREAWDEPERKKSWLMRKLKQESLIKVDSGDFKLRIDPLYDFYFADIENASGDGVLTNGRGVLVRGAIGAKFTYYSSFMENQSYFPEYLDSYVDYAGMVPGSGRTKPFKKTGYDYAMASGFLSYTPFKNLHFMAGHFKQFIGEGYRSLLLSDNAFNYPFLRASYNFWKHKLEYTYSIASLRQLERLPATKSTEPQLISKWMSYNYLTFKPNKFIELGVFESFIWQRWDSTGTKAVQTTALLPVLGLNTASYGLNAGRNNGLIGFNLKVNPIKGITAYSQYVKGNFSKEDAFQLGLKVYNLGLKNLKARLEYNTVSGFMYTGRNRFLSYGHYGQSLTHIQGRDFDELYFELNYMIKDFFVRAQVSSYNVQRDSLAWQSQDLSSMYRNPVINEQVSFQDFQLGYLINPSYNLNIALGYRKRMGEHDDFGENSWLYLVLRTSLNRQYFDF